MAWWESRISRFQDASTLGRILGFILVWWVGTTVAILVDGSGLVDSNAILAAPVWGAFLTCWIMVEGWGLVPVVLLLVAFTCHVAGQRSPATTLLFVFLVQSMAIFITLLDLPVPGSWGAWATWPSRMKVFLLVWLLLFITWILRAVVSRWSMVTLGPLNTLLLGREPVEEAYDHEPPSREDHERLEWTEVEESSDGE